MTATTKARLTRIDYQAISRASCVDWLVEPNSDPDKPEGESCTWVRGWISDNRRTTELAKAHSAETGHVVEVERLHRSKVMP